MVLIVERLAYVGRGRVLAVLACAYTTVVGVVKRLGNVLGRVG